jgi:hypothetical protein
MGPLGDVQSLKERDKSVRLLWENDWNIGINLRKKSEGKSEAGSVP